MFNSDISGMSVQDVIDLIEADPRGFHWMVGHCPCGLKEGDYSARIVSKDYAPPQPTLNLATGSVSYTAARGVDVTIHGKTPAMALKDAYALAQAAP